MIHVHCKNIYFNGNLYFIFQTFIRNFTKALQYENRKSGVTIQILSPGIVNTKMTQFTHHILPDSIITPTAKQYAKQAIGTLGVIDHTAGYQPHSILVSIYNYLIKSFLIGLLDYLMGIKNYLLS